MENDQSIDNAATNVTEVLQCPSVVDVLSSLQLRRIVKENHGEGLNCLSMNALNDGSNHMVVTCGKDQVNVYDNKHCGNSLDLCCQFVNEKSEYQTGGDVRVACWLKVLLLFLFHQPHTQWCT